MAKALEKVRGLTIIELMVALVVSGFLISVLYRTFIGQQRMYTVQEQVADMRQNARGAVSNMIREIRMAGFGRVEMILPVTFSSGTSSVTYTHVVNSNKPSPGLITIVTAIDSNTRSSAMSEDLAGMTVIVTDVSHFDTEAKKYISLSGIESNTVVNVDRLTNKLTLKEKPIYRHPTGSRVYPIRAITYKIKAGTLYRDENTPGTNQPMTEGNTIESVQYEYLNAQRIPTLDDAAIRIIRINVTARTEKPDPQFKGIDGYRRRQISSTIQIRNMEVSP